MIVLRASFAHAPFRLLLILALAGTVLAPPLYAQSPDTTGGPLSVRVVGLDSDAGTVRIALNDAQNYEGEGNVRAAALPIENGTARWTIDDVPPGRYAVRLYHDKNDNGELDTNMLGVPKEAFGFSNDARGRMGPPDFEETAFTIASDSLSMTITAK